MQPLADQKGKIAGFLLDNIIILPDGEVIGLILGRCVFNKKGELTGKFFKGHLFALNGNILARKDDSIPEKIILEKAAKIREAAWAILSLSNNHLCPWVEPSGEWSQINLKSFFCNDE